MTKKQRHYPFTPLLDVDAFYEVLGEWVSMGLTEYMPRRNGENQFRLTSKGKIYIRGELRQ